MSKTETESRIGEGVSPVQEMKSAVAEFASSFNVSGDGFLVKEFRVGYCDKSNHIMQVNAFVPQELSMCSECVT